MTLTALSTEPIMLMVMSLLLTQKNTVDCISAHRHMNTKNPIIVRPMHGQAG